MAGRFAGLLQSDVYGVVFDEMRLGHLRITAAQGVAAAADGVHAAITGSGSAVTTVTTAITNPPCPRNLTITPGGTTADVKGMSITVTGTNIKDERITEDFAFLANATAATVGAKAFKTVTSISIPAQDGAGATFAVGFGELIGLPVMLTDKPLTFVKDDGVIMTAPTMTIDADEIEKNVIDINGSLDGSVYDVFMAL